MSLLALKPSRLYSRYPGGSVGLALLVLRLVDGLGLFGESMRLLTPTGTSSEPTSTLLLSLALGASAILLTLGLRTILAGSAGAACTVGAALYGTNYLNPSGSGADAWLFLFAIVFFLSGSLALLGPGSYSLDARFSGWRMIKLSSRRPSSKDAD
jgi:hypothetical protein